MYCPVGNWRYGWCVVLLAFAGCQGGGAEPTENPEQITLEKCPSQFDNGQTCTFVVTGFPAGAIVTWRTSSGQILKIVEVGVYDSGGYWATVTAVGLGSATISATGAGMIGTAEVVVRSPTLSGTVSHLAGDAACISDSRAYVCNGAIVDSADIRPDGSFVVEMPLLGGEDSVDVVIDAKDTTRRACFPALATVIRTKPGQNWPTPWVERAVRLLRVPRTWTVRKGRFAGQTIPISLELAYTPPSDSVSAFYPGGLGDFFGQRRFAYRFQAAWYLPLSVAFDRARSNRPVSAGDSVTFWAAVDSLEVALGEDVFRPTDLADRYYGVVHVLVDSTISIPVGEPAYGDCGGGFCVPSAFANISGGWVRLPDVRLLGDMRTTEQVLLGVLGFGTTCAWNTAIFSGPRDRCPESRRSQGLTAYDVAYKELFYAAAAGYRPGSRRILPEAHQGERVLMLGLPRQQIYIFQYDPDL